MNIFRDLKINLFEGVFWTAVFAGVSMIVGGFVEALVWMQPSLRGLSIPVGFGLGFGLAGLIFMFVHKIGLSDIKDLLRPFPSLMVAALCVLLYFTSLPIAEYLSQLIPTEGVPYLEKLWKIFETTFAMVFEHKIAAFITICILAPLIEELLFRGFILRGMKNYGVNPWIAIPLSAFLFGAAHMNPWQLLGAGFIGLILGYIYWKTASLWLVIFLHALNNIIAFVITVKSENLEEMIFDMQPYFLVIPAAVSIGVAWLIHQKTTNPKLESDFENY
ncbi:MAG: type II CAAX endopeptidase family protein [Weeksellaceae bacterium]|nr:type II CAAX endopeptidase family protein [Weeksellaceae bacterium]